MTKRPELFNIQMIEIPRRKSPEQELWCMVLDRALADYAFFFDWFLNIQKQSGNLHADYPAMMNRELRSLEWFLFSKETRPHNMNWIMDYCYDGDDLLARMIRTKVKEKFDDNLARNKDEPRLKPFLDSLLKGAPVPEIKDKVPMKKPRHPREIIH